MAMPNLKCTLRTFHPSPTTVSFTVSTASAHDTVSSRLVHHAFVCIKALAAAYVILILYAKWHIISSGPTSCQHVLLETSFVGSIVTLVARNIPTRYLLPLGLFGLWILGKRWYTEESLLVLRGLGIQTTTSSSTYLSTATTRFIPTTSIQDIFIHEAFKGFEVRFYLAIVIEGEEDVLVVFPVRLSTDDRSISISFDQNLLPGRVILEEVWRGARKCLYEPRS